MYDPQVYEIAKSVRADLIRIYGIEDCNTLCAIGSIWLAKKLEAAGYNDVRVHGAGSRPFIEHCFVVIHSYEPVLVDCTATQFDRAHDDVVILDYRKALAAKWYWRTTHEFKPSEARKMLIKMGWPKEQLP